MDSENPYSETRAAVLAVALPHVPFDGWSQNLLSRAIDEAGVDSNMAALAFPKGASDLVAEFSAQGDALMLESLAAPDELKIRDRIRNAVVARIEADLPHKEAARRAAGFLSVPGRAVTGSKLVFHTAHRIWRWAGDTSTDYNYYTKRLILGGVLTTTRLAWFADDSDDMAATRAFLDRRIDNVMQFEKAKAKIRDCADGGLAGIFKKPASNMAKWRDAAENVTAQMRPDSGTAKGD